MIAVGGDGGEGGGGGRDDILFFELVIFTEIIFIPNHVLTLTICSN